MPEKEEEEEEEQVGLAHNETGGVKEEGVEVS